MVLRTKYHVVGLERLASNERLTLARSSTSNILLGKIASKYASYIPLKLVQVVAILCNDLEGVSKAGVHLLHRTLRGTMQDTSMPSTGMTVTQRTTLPRFAQTAGTYVCSFGCLIGIDHKRQKRTVTHFVQHDGTRTKTVGCTDKRVDLQIGSNYCKQCYRERPGTREEKLDGINYSRMGCPSCEERICKECWAKGYDMHQKKRA